MVGPKAGPLEEGGVADRLVTAETDENATEETATGLAFGRRPLHGQHQHCKRRAEELAVDRADAGHRGRRNFRQIQWSTAREQVALNERVAAHADHHSTDLRAAE